jgi:Arc/MetJ family transcription regulator
MRTTIIIDDELLHQARAFTGLTKESALVRESLNALIQREAARRLARLGRSERSLKFPKRRRPQR